MLVTSGATPYSVPLTLTRISPTVCPALTGAVREVPSSAWVGNRVMTRSKELRSTSLGNRALMDTLGRMATVWASAPMITGMSATISVDLTIS